MVPPPGLQLCSLAVGDTNSLGFSNQEKPHGAEIGEWLFSTVHSTSRASLVTSGGRGWLTWLPLWERRRHPKAPTHACTLWGMAPHPHPLSASRTTVWLVLCTMMSGSCYISIQQTPRHVAGEQSGLGTLQTWLPLCRPSSHLVWN